MTPADPHKERGTSQLEGVGPHAFSWWGKRLSEEGFEAKMTESSAERQSSSEIDALIRNLTDPDWSVRRRAALELADVKDRRAVPALISLLQDHETVWSAAQDAAYALGEIGDGRAVEPLIDLLDEPFVAGRAIEALEKIGDPRMVEPLIRVFVERPEASIATVLGRLGDKRSVEPLIEALKSPNPSIRFYAARALGKLGDKRALAALVWSVENDREPIRDRRSIRGKSVSDAAGKAIERIERGSEGPNSSL